MSNDLSSSSLLSLAKERYLDGKLEEIVYKDAPFFAKVRKKGGQFIGGKYLVVPLNTSHNDATGSHLGNAMTAAATANSTEGAVAYQVPRVSQYNPFKLDGDLVDAVKGGDTGFIDAFTKVTDGSLKELSLKICQNMYRTGYGFKGRVLTGSISTNTLKLVNPEDIYGWEKGQRIVWSASLNANLLRNSGGTTTLTVTKVDRPGFTVTFSANVSTVTGATDNDFMFAADDREDSATPAVRNIAGAGLWVPDTLSAATIFGVNLATADSRAQGQNFDATTGPIEENIQKAAAFFNRVEPTCTPDCLMINPMKWADLEIALGQRVRYVEEMGSDVAVGFRSIKLGTSYGGIQIYGDPSCPVDRGFMLTMDTWTLAHVGPSPIALWDGDGLQVIRDTSGQTEALVGFYKFRGNLFTDAPSHNGVLKFA